MAALLEARVFERIVVAYTAWFQRASDSQQCVSCLDSWKGTEKPLSEAVKKKIVLNWRRQDVKDVGVLRHLPRKAMYREYNQPPKQQSWTGGTTYIL